MFLDDLQEKIEFFFLFLRVISSSSVLLLDSWGSLTRRSCIICWPFLSPGYPCFPGYPLDSNRMTLFVKLAADDRCLVSFVTNRGGHKWLVVVAYYVFDYLASLFVLVPVKCSVHHCSPFFEWRYYRSASNVASVYDYGFRWVASGDYHSSTSIFVPSAAETSVCSTLTAPFIRMMSKVFSVASLVLLSPSRSGWSDPFRFWSSQGGHLMAEIGVGVHPGVAFLSVCSFRSSCLCKISGVFCLLVPNS